MIEDVDAWIPHHFDDSLAHPAVVAAASFDVAWSLPPVFSAPGCRLILYVASDMPALLAWLDSDELKGAIEDGAEREAQTITVDGDPFTGNIYAVTAERGEYHTDFVSGGGLFVERYEVSADSADEFDNWFGGPHLNAVQRWPGAVRVRTWRQNRDVPARFPYDRYTSTGNRMLTADFAPASAVAQLLEHDDVWRTVADSAAWDVRLPYVRREAGEMLVQRPAPFGS
jgi:hypothetical protein